jgi:hypothetical protein
MATEYFESARTLEGLLARNQHSCRLRAIDSAVICPTTVAMSSLKE